MDPLSNSPSREFWPLAEGCINCFSPASASPVAHMAPADALMDINDIHVKKTKTNPKQCVWRGGIKQKKNRQSRKQTISHSVCHMPCFLFFRRNNQMDYGKVPHNPFSFLNLFKSLNSIYSKSFHRLSHVRLVKCLLMRNHSTLFVTCKGSISFLFCSYFHQTQDKDSCFLIVWLEIRAVV